MAESGTEIALRHSPRLSRLGHPWRLGGAGVVLLAMLVGAFLVGRFVGLPSRDVILDAQDTIEVLAVVEQRVVDSRINFAGTVRAGAEIELFAGAAVSPTVVVRRTLSIGDVVPLGCLVGVVSGQPFFVLPGPLPTYRDLSRGDTGDDVVAFQAALANAGWGPAPTGIIDGDTISAVQDLFEANGFELEWDSPIPYKSFLSVPNGNGVVTSVAQVGTHLDADTPLLSLSAGAAQVFFRADAVTSAALNVGDAMTVHAGRETFDGVISSIGEFGAGADGVAPGRDVLISSPDPTLPSLPVGSSVTVLGPGDDEETIAVPVTALRLDDTGDYVEIAISGDGGQGFRRVPVSILRTGEGWAALNDDGGLKPGDKVRVS